MHRSTKHSYSLMFLVLYLSTFTSLAICYDDDFDQPQPYGYYEGVEHHKRMDLISNALDRAEMIMEPDNHDTFKQSLERSYDNEQYKYDESEYAERGYRYVDEFDGKPPVSSTFDWIASVMDYGFIVESNQKPTFYFDSMLPIYTSEDDKQTFFAQHRVSRQLDLGTLLSLGFGYRQLMADKKFIAGANTFVDYSTLENHSRMGLGFEAIANSFEARANYYHALSSQREVGAFGREVFEKAVNGFDLEAGGRVPFIPWVKLFGGYQRYFHANTPDKKGWTSRALLTPVKCASVNLEAYNWENDETSYRMEGQLHLPFSSFSPSDLMNDIRSIAKDNTEQPKTVIDLTPRMRERVRRNFVIATERWDGDNSPRAIGNLGNVQLIVRFPSVVPTFTDPNSNGFVDAGETFEIDFILTNNTSNTATGVAYSNATTTLGIVDFNDFAELPDAPPGGTTRTDEVTDMDFTIPALTAPGTQFFFSLDFTADGDTQSFTFGPFTVGAIYHNQVINYI